MSNTKLAYDANFELGYKGTVADSYSNSDSYTRRKGGDEEWD